jgi:hypothetical protein
VHTQGLRRTAGRLFLLLALLLTGAPDLTHLNKVALAQGPPPPTVTVIIERVKALDCVDEIWTPFGSYCPPGSGKADFYAEVTIDNQLQPRTGWISDDDDISPNWWFRKTISPAAQAIPILITIKDHDDNSDDLIDIAYGNSRSLDLTLNLTTCRISGAVPGSCTTTITSSGSSNDRAQIWFRIDTNLPQVNVSGTIYDGERLDRSRPIGGHRVELVDESTDRILATHYTLSTGEFSFNLRAPILQRLRVRLAPCSNCQLFNPWVEPTNVQPWFVTPLEVFYPGCAAGASCRYAHADYFMLRPSSVGAVRLDSADPSIGSELFILRDAPRKEIPATPVTIRGANLHDWTRVHLCRADACPAFPGNCTCYPAAIASRAPDWAEVQVSVPNLPANTPRPSQWFWAVQDTWLRPGVNEWTKGGSFIFDEPPYPKVHGFGFDNTSDTAGLGDFDGAFGNNAYICIGAFGLCACRVRDPLYLLYYPIYKIWLDNTNGSCAGLAATSLLMKHEYLQPETFDANVYYPAGFTDAGKPARFDNPTCGPRRPRNLWAVVRSNHGVQTSAEFIEATYDDMRGGGFSIDGKPVQRLQELRASPLGSVVCMTPSLGKGHCVTPYAVKDVSPSLSHILIYDNREPEDENRYIEIDHSTNRYRYPRTDGTVWSGTGLYTIPYDVWLRPRTAPGVAEALEFIFLAVFGGADGLYTTPDGGAWGWQSDGSVIDALPGAVALPPLDPSDQEPHNVPLVLPMSAPPPHIQVNTRGGTYLFHAAQGGHVLQLEVLDAPQGSADELTVNYEAERLGSFRFTPERDTPNLLASIGMVLGERERAVFRWSELSVPADGSVEFKALSEAKGVHYRNDTGGPTRYFLTLDVVDGAAEITSTRIFGPFVVPDGAEQRIYIEDWPDTTQLVSEVDTNGDGMPDQTHVVTGPECTPGDVDGDGIPDVCGPLPTYPLYLPFVSSDNNVGPN